MLEMISSICLFELTFELMINVLLVKFGVSLRFVLCIFGNKII